MRLHKKTAEHYARLPPPLGNDVMFGMAKGELHYPDDIDFCNADIAEMFRVSA